MPAGRRPYNPGEPTLCNLCEVQFSSPKIHKRVFHGDKEEVRCVFCGIPFLWTSALTKHLSVHADTSDLFCCVCLTSFETIESLSSHLETHSQLHAFFCGRCKQTFHSRKVLISHDCSALTPAHPVAVIATMERDLRVEGLPRPEDVVSNCLPNDLILPVDVNEKSVSSELALSPKVYYPTIIVGSRRCSFSASTVNEVKIYHAQDETSCCTEVAPCEVLNTSGVPGDMETAGDGPQMPNSALIPSITGEGTVPNHGCKSNETSKYESHIVLSKEQNCAPLTADGPSPEAQLPKSSTHPKENGFHSPPIENCQVNFQDGLQIFTPDSTQKCLILIKADHEEKANLPVTANRVNTPEDTYQAQLVGCSESLSHTVDTCSSKIPEANIPNHQIVIQKVDDVQTAPSVEVSEEASSVKPSHEPSASVASTEGADCPKARSDSQTVFNFSSKNNYVSQDESEKTNAITTDEIRRKLASIPTIMANPVSPILLQDTVVKAVSDYTAFVKPDLGKDLKCVPVVQNEEPTELAAEAAADPLADAEKLPSYITRRRNRMHRINTVYEDSGKNSVIPESIPSVCKSEEMPVCGDEVKEGPGPLRLANLVAPRLHESEISEGFAERKNSAAPGLIRETAKAFLGSGNGLLSSDAPSFSQEDTVAFAEALPRCIARRRHQTRRVTTACGLYHASGKTHRTPGRSETEQISISKGETKESGSGPTSVNNLVTLHLQGHKVGAFAEHTNDAEHGLIGKDAVAIQLQNTVSSTAPRCLEQEPPQQPLQSQNCEVVKTTVSKLADAVVLPNCVLRQRRKTRRLTTAQGMSRGSASNQSISDSRPPKSEKFQNRNQSMSVSKEETNGELPGPTSLENPAALRLHENNIVEGLAEHIISAELDLIKEEAKIILDKEGRAVSNAPPGRNQEAPQRILRHNSKAAKTTSVGEAPVALSAFNRRVRKTRRFTAVHGMSPAKKSLKIPEGGPHFCDTQSSSGPRNDMKEEVTGDAVKLGNSVALQAYESVVAEKVAEHTANATFDLISDGSKGTLDEEIGRLTAIIIGIPAANKNAEVPEGGLSLNDFQRVTIPQNKIEGECTIEPISLENPVAVRAHEYNIAERVEPTSDITKNPIKEGSKATYDLESITHSSQMFLQQGDCKAVETTAAAEAVPRVLSRRGRKTRRLTTVPEISASNKNPEEPSVPIGNDDHFKLEGPSARLHDVEAVAERSSAVRPDPPPSCQDKEPSEPFTSFIHGNTEAAIVAADALALPKRRRRKTRRLTTVHEEGHEETGLNDTLVDIANKSSRRSTRKRRPSRRVENVCPLENENISPSSQVVLPGNSDPTPPDSPVSRKKKRISFNETIECWNPILQEMTWRGICDDIREVPLLRPVPKSKGKKKGNVKKKKARRSSKAALPDEYVQDESENVVKIDGICVPTSLKAPNNLRPVLKPSPVPVAPSTNGEQLKTDTPKRKYAQRKLVLKNMKHLVEKYGADFSYKRCLKVDGRFHCPDEDCMDNDHRGYNNEKALRNHIKTNHIDVDCPTCDKCGKCFATYSRLNEHKIIHSDALLFPCKNCDKSFKTAALLKQHAGTHGGCGECFYCSRTFSSKRTLANHFRDTPYKCDCCEIALWCPTMFANHETQIEHHYHCPVCLRTYQTRVTFIRHVRAVHYDQTTAFDGRYQCLSCERKFTHWKNIYRHMRRNHTIPGLVVPSVSLVTKSS